jgi:hypothetical protein
LGAAEDNSVLIRTYLYCRSLAKNVVENYKNGLSVESVNKQYFLALSITGPIMEKSEDYLNNLVQFTVAAADKNTFLRILNFIDED